MIPYKMIVFDTLEIAAIILYYAHIAHLYFTPLAIADVPNVASLSHVHQQLQTHNTLYAYKYR